MMIALFLSGPGRHNIFTFNSSTCSYTPCHRGAILRSFFFSFSSLASLGTFFLHFFAGGMIVGVCMLKKPLGE